MMCALLSLTSRTSRSSLKSRTQDALRGIGRNVSTGGVCENCRITDGRSPPDALPMAVDTSYTHMPRARPLPCCACCAVLHRCPPCRCIYPQCPAPAHCTRCADAGVLGPVPGVMGTLQALECIKLLTGVGEPLSQVRLALAPPPPRACSGAA